MPQKTPANSSRRATSDTLEKTNASLLADCDRYRQRNERLQDKVAKFEDKNSKQEDKISKYEDKLDAANRELRHAKDEIKRLMAEIQLTTGQKDTLEKACKQLRYEKETMDNMYTSLKASYENLMMKYDAIPEERRNPMTAAALPERSKRSATASATSGGSGASSRAQQDSDRGRSRRADKERLGARFETTATPTSSTTKRPPLASANRSSFIEGYGSSRRRSGSAAAPLSRGVMYESAVHTGRFEDPVVSPREAVAFSTVPRRVPSNGGYHSGSSGLLDDDYEDGDYHIRTIH
ncbi:hypothetical protein NLU13_4203 [Sarocladium strictum]|uniref:Uncharacterized protein n=1 Tax=Sarocladium strictum TaxID=5046 RepID=A0AA39GJ84_SARSR|nr:hypothetical protein NLU13_4203 [Sarocladium strictum]